MTEAHDRPASGAGWTDALARGFGAFVAVAAIGQALALVVWAVTDTAASVGAFARIGWIYIGVLHHVAVELDVADVALATPDAGPGATSLSIGVALLALTAVAALLLFRAGKRRGHRVGGSVRTRILAGAAVAPSYAIPVFALALLVEVNAPWRLGAFASGELHVSLSPWQALVFPLGMAGVAGGAGGLWSALEGGATERDRWIGAAVVGGWRMLVTGIALSLAGLVVAGMVQPDEPVALLTPSTARYFRAMVGDPAAGSVLLGHHLAAAPNEALWTLVPAMGGCDGVRGSANADFLCYARFPTDVGTSLWPFTGGPALRVPFGGTTFEPAPAGYFAFLVVPAVATVLGGRRAARLLGVRGRPAVAVGAVSGVVFAGLVAVTAALSTVTIGYGAAFGPDATAGWIAVGPDVVTAAPLALAWGVIGGGLGAATSR